MREEKKKMAESESKLRKPLADALALLNARINEGQALFLRTPPLLDRTGPDGEAWEGQVTNWNTGNAKLLERLFSSPVEYLQYVNTDVSPMDESIGAASGRKLMRLRIQYLEAIRDSLQFYEVEEEVRGGRAARPATPSTREVFVIHGHDEAAKQEVARTLERLELKPIILHEQADKGRSILEKFEAHAEASGYAIALLTPDDACGAGHRARQNVILELGYFLGALGRGKVRALYKPGVELPSDLHGWLYTEMDVAGAWKLLLARELRAAGFDVDLNRLA